MIAHLRQDAKGGVGIVGNRQEQAPQQDAPAQTTPGAGL
jgi:hypothetical protein